jgi:hypothetical protein
MMDHPDLPGIQSKVTYGFGFGVVRYCDHAIRLFKGSRCDLPEKCPGLSIHLFGIVPIVQIVQRYQGFPLSGKDQRGGRMGQVKLGPEYSIQFRSLQAGPHPIDPLGRPTPLTQLPLLEEREPGGREAVFEGGGKQKIGVVGIDLGQREKQVLIIDTDTCLLFEERP